MKTKLIKHTSYHNEYLLLEFEKPTDFSFEAGQFIKFKVEDQNKFYSLASAPTKNSLDLIARLEPDGVASRFLLNLKPDDVLPFEGPYGHFVLQKNLKPKIFIATGAGIAPIRGMIQQLVHIDYASPFYLFWSLRTSQEQFLQTEFKELKKRNNHFSYEYFFSREQNKKEYHIQQYLKDKALQQNWKANNFEYYLCGKLENVEIITQFLASEMRVSDSQIFFEKFV